MRHFANLFKQFSAMPMNQLPILEHEGKVECQHIPICRYLGKKCKLMGKDDWEDLVIDGTAEIINELRFSKSIKEKKIGILTIIKNFIYVLNAKKQCYRIDLIITNNINDGEEIVSIYMCIDMRTMRLVIPSLDSTVSVP